MDDVEVPGVAGVGGHLGQGQLGQIRQAQVVEVRVVRPHRVEHVELLELLEPQGGVQVRHVVLVAGVLHLVVPGALRRVALPGVAADPVQAAGAQQVGVVVGVGGDHPALAGGQVLDRVEAEHGQVADGADQVPLVAGGQGVGGVLDDLQAVPGGQLEEGVHLAGGPGHVDGDDGARARGDGPLHQHGIHLQRAGQHVHQDRPGPEVQDDGRRRGERVDAGDDLVTGLEARWRPAPGAAPRCRS